jgi:hypothetical protein
MRRACKRIIIGLGHRPGQPGYLRTTRSDSWITEPGRGPVDGRHAGPAVPSAALRHRCRPGPGESAWTARVGIERRALMVGFRWRPDSWRQVGEGAGCRPWCRWTTQVLSAAEDRQASSPEPAATNPIPGGDDADLGAWEPRGPGAHADHPASLVEPARDLYATDVDGSLRGLDARQVRWSTTGKGAGLGADDAGSAVSLRMVCG